MRYRLLRLYGADGNDEAEGDKGDKGEKKEEIKSQTLTADELTKIAARAADRASRKAGKKLAEELGFESVSAMKESVAKQKAIDDEAKSDADKAAEKLATDQAETTASGAKVAAERLELQIKLAIVGTGVTDSKKLERLSTLVSAEIEDVGEEDGWAAQIAESVEGLQSDVPELFGKSSKSRGSGDGGASGESEEKPDEKESEKKQEEGWRDEYKRRGMVERDLSAELK